ncbi:hypothetical protein N7512_002805 [Penicillium capsulatum]|nr:hypothetical protein N7512_002805 [Penicillium capsulatum]
MELGLRFRIDITNVFAGIARPDKIILVATDDDGYLRASVQVSQCENYRARETSVKLCFHPGLTLGPET